MALIERFENDKIEVVGSQKIVQVRTANIIEKDGVEIARSHHRHVLHCGELDGSDNLIDTDISGEPSDVQAICNAIWTDSFKESYKAMLIDAKTAGNI